MVSRSLLLLAAVFTGCSLAYYQPPLVFIDIDGPPSALWLHALDAIMTRHEWEDSFGPVFSAINDTVFNHLPAYAFEAVPRGLRQYWPTYYQELAALADRFASYGHPEVTFDYLAMWTYYHSLAHGKFGSERAAASNFFSKECTGVLAASANGTVIHGRNMDNIPDQLRNITVHFKIRQNGVVVAEAVDWYWTGGGFMTVFMPHVISMEENWRMYFQDENGTAIVEAIANGAISQNWIFREALFGRNLRTFDEIVNYVATVPAPAPMYAIIAGPQPMQGAIISRDPHQTYPVLLLSNQTGPNAWFLVETNYDHWLPDPTDDPRRTVAQNTLAAAGRSIVTMSGIYSVMATPPVLNGGTVFTAVMAPSSGQIIIVGQDADAAALPGGMH